MKTYTQVQWHCPNCEAETTGRPVESIDAFDGPEVGEAPGVKVVQITCGECGRSWREKHVRDPGLEDRPASTSLEQFG